MEIIDQWRDRLTERKKLLKDRIYKWNLMKQFGDHCPRCSRKLISFSVHDKDCYKKFITLGRRVRNLKISRSAKGRCVVCGKVSVDKKRVFCEFCGYYK